jgi:flagellar FliL protein
MAKKKKAEAELDGSPAPKKSKKKLVIIALLVVVLGGGGYVAMGRGGAAAAAAPKPGAVVPLEPIHLNLAGGHYLKLGLALQATLGAKEAPDGSKALDIAIELLSNRSVSELDSTKTREAVKKELVKQVSKAYEGDVMDVYFTEFVSQ